jgi:serine phosphatase RsbU (regulator of sigma subunit)
MGQLRATARAHAHGDVEPRAVLAHLDAALGRLEQDQITTALFALLDPVTRTITVASAGHLPPLVTRPDGGAEYLDVRPGPPLGTGAAVYPQLTAVLPAGSMLLLYTDGLVEDRRLTVDVGLENLLSAASGSSSAEDLCGRVLHALGRDSAHDDDTALLAVALTGAEDQDSAMRAPTK